MGGEKAATVRAVCGPRGSPPRGRGKAPAEQTCQHNAGITPAWAGKREQRAYLMNRDGDHPRVGGEKGAVARRGTRGVGITPAWAGKSQFWDCQKGVKKDHPRVGGEKLSRAELDPTRRGSPPRGRGKALQLLHGHSHIGITPAWAGKSPSQSSFFALHWDHPRVGGEKGMPGFQGGSAVGSPPRGRGKD